MSTGPETQTESEIPYSFYLEEIADEYQEQTEQPEFDDASF
jgi:hypothetical protein